MKILHTSDWHLGRSLHGYSLLEDQAFVLKQLLAVIEEEQVDLLLIAGDIYDKTIPSEGAVELFNDFISQVTLKYKLDTVIISGNHDSGERIDFGSKLFMSQHLYITGKCEKGYQKITVNIKDQEIDVFMIPYIEPCHVREIAGDESIKRHDEAIGYLVSKIKEEQREIPTILVAHAFVTGGELSESERRLSVVGGADLVRAEHFKDFTYTALGHLHKRQAMGQRVRYSGSLLKYSTSEANQKKGYVLLTLEGNQLKDIEERALTPKRDVRIIKGSLEEIIAGASEDMHKEDYVYVKVEGNPLQDTTATLRHIYPNILGSEWLEEEKGAQEGENTNSTDFMSAKEKTITEVFMEFLDFIGENTFDEEEKAYIQATIKEIEEGKYEA